MKNLLATVDEAVSQGARWRVDLKNRTLKVDGKIILDKDTPINEVFERSYSGDEFLQQLELFYVLYQHSVPSERSESRTRSYFMALSESELSDDDFLYGQSREVSQFRLEAFVLVQILHGLKWEESWGKWFWQSQNMKDLVLLREWIDEA